MDCFVFSFFLDPASVGQSRAKIAMSFLQELNPDVNGESIDDNVETIIEKNSSKGEFICTFFTYLLIVIFPFLDYFKTFNAVVACSLNEKSLVKLSNLLWDMNIPLIVCRSVGFIGSARLQVKEVCVVETHPDNKQSDLRLEEPFDTLKEHIDVSDTIFLHFSLFKLQVNFF